MKRIRQLFFQNAAGERVGLNGQQGVYASDLSGFGLDLSPDFADLSRGFFSITQDEAEPQATSGMTITFTKNPYLQYYTFVNWLASAGTLTLIYSPVEGREYWRDICLGSLQKGELNAVGWLPVPCSFYCLTPWYLPTPTAMELEADTSEDIRRYTFTYTNSLRYGSDSLSALSCKIPGSGHIPGAMRLTYSGLISDPELKLTDDTTGKLIGRCKIYAQLSETDTLVFCTRYDQSYAKVITATGEEWDLLDVLDLSMDPFFHLPVNRSCTFSIESSAEISGVAELQVYHYYRSV